MKQYKISSTQTTQVFALPRFAQFLQASEFPHKLGIMDRLFGANAAKQGICWVSTAAGISWKLDLRNCTHRWILYGKYEGVNFHHWARTFIPRNGIIVDSGANIGQMLIYLSPLVPEGRILAFEPGPYQADWLAECLQLNANLPVELIRLGLGAEARTVFLDNEGSLETHGGQSFVSEVGGTPIRIARLEDELTKRQLTRVNLWKLDVEGYELAALAGARSLLEQQRIDAIYAELHGENGYSIKEYLAKFGYQCHAISNKGQLTKLEVLPEHTNGLFLPS
jgi:FkbM family methyltransferase